jgi:molybdopterin converting factor small subunit
VTVGSVLDALAVDHPALERRVRDELGRTRVHVNLFVGSNNVRDLDGLGTPITPGVELSIIPAISGG